MKSYKFKVGTQVRWSRHDNLKDVFTITEYYHDVAGKKVVYIKSMPGSQRPWSGYVFDAELIEAEPPVDYNDGTWI